MARPIAAVLAWRDEGCRRPPAGRSESGTLFRPLLLGPHTPAALLVYLCTSCAVYAVYAQCERRPAGQNYSLRTLRGLVSDDQPGKATGLGYPPRKQISRPKTHLVECERGRPYSCILAPRRRCCAPSELGPVSIRGRAGRRRLPKHKLNHVDWGTSVDS